MTIKLTPDEIKKYVATALNLHSGAFDLEIVSPNKAVRDCSLVVAFRAAIREFPFYATIEKISAIKRFRELAPKHDEGGGYSSCTVGLADAKWAVENPSEAVANLERTGSIRG